MKICAIICEYNPFHRGHAYQLTRARELSGADYVVCLMSGPFVQRGDIAVADKWKRTESALSAGADAVFELPALYALRAAPDFARGGVSLALALGCDSLSFGCETDDIELLKELCELDPSDSALIRTSVSNGVSYPKALAAFYQDALGPDFQLTPNLLLAVEYLRANRHFGGALTPVPVLRTHPHDAPGIGEYASASALRQGLYEGLPEAFSAAGLPADTKLNHPEQLTQVILWKLRSMTPDEIRGIVDISEGLENRLLNAAQKETTWDGVIRTAGCARYTNARIRRALFCSVLDVTRELNQRFPAVPYARLLGLRRDSSALLAHIKRHASVPVYTKMADAPDQPCLALDFRAQNLFDLALGLPPWRDLTTSPIIL